jgi:hypothetical protein
MEKNMRKRAKSMPTGEVMKVRTYKSSDLTNAMLKKLAEKEGVSPSAMHTILIRRSYQRTQL